VCDHHQKNVGINNVGDYIFFPSTCLHHGYYNHEAKKDLYHSATLCRPSIEPDTKHFKCSFTQAQDFIQGKPDESIIKELSNDLLLNWVSAYFVDEFPLCKGFDGLTVDQESNRQATRS
jgi:hypothetical protein